MEPRKEKLKKGKTLKVFMSIINIALFSVFRILFGICPLIERGFLKQKRPNEPELPQKTQRIETSKRAATTVVDVGPAADYVKINIREIKDCFEIYALVPGLLREEVFTESKLFLLLEVGTMLSC